jgi:uncharacterized YccA/Bax inhibitor family protein
MIESRLTLLVLLVVMLSGFALTLFGNMNLGTIVILIGAVGYFIFNKKG